MFTVKFFNLNGQTTISTFETEATFLKWFEDPNKGHGAKRAQISVHEPFNAHSKYMGYDGLWLEFA